MIFSPFYRIFVDMKWQGNSTKILLAILLFIGFSFLKPVCKHDSFGVEKNYPQPHSQKELMQYMNQKLNDTYRKPSN